MNNLKLNDLKPVICIFFEIDYREDYENYGHKDKLIALYEKDEDAIKFLESINEEWIKQYVINHTDEWNKRPEIVELIRAERFLTSRGGIYFECENTCWQELCITINVEKRLLNQDFNL
jgi:hypothetical protein